MSIERPTKDEIRNVLHALCVYAHDNHCAMRVVAEGVDGAGNGILEFGVDIAPEDLEGSSIEQLVERLSSHDAQDTS